MEDLGRVPGSQLYFIPGLTHTLSLVLSHSLPFQKTNVQEADIWISEGNQLMSHWRQKSCRTRITLYYFSFVQTAVLCSYAGTLTELIWAIFQKCLTAESCYKVKLCETDNDFSMCKGSQNYTRHNKSKMSTICFPSSGEFQFEGKCTSLEFGKPNGSFIVGPVYTGGHRYITSHSILAIFMIH